MPTEVKLPATKSVSLSEVKLIAFTMLFEPTCNFSPSGCHPTSRLQRAKLLTITDFETSLLAKTKLPPTYTLSLSIVISLTLPLSPFPNFSH